MSGIIGSKLNIRGSGLVGSLGTDGQHLLSSGAGKTNVFETAAGGGKILQVVSDTVPGGSTTTTSGTFDTKMTGLATIITPTSSSNKILLLGSCLIQTTSAEKASAVSLYKKASDFTET